MAELDKLAIRGVRAFDPKSINIIQFFKPLTLIVGHNGSGKTTIVECLKYAATGDLPPNTKGGAFVYDPYMAGCDSVKAQIRLRFRNTSGVRMGCVRNLQVSKKKGGGLTMKTLEGVLGVDDAERGSRSTISTRCAALDEEMALLLGVSRAVLENVLFCHQEESFWPLSEPSVLKRKFDEIFEVTRYTKALDAVRALRKQRAQDARVDEADLRALQQEKERADSTQAKIRALHTSLAHKSHELADTDAAVSHATRENQALYDQAARFREVITQAESLEERLALYETTRDDIRSGTALLDGTDDELQHTLDSLPADLDAQRTALADAETERTALRAEQARLDALHHDRLARHGELQAVEKAYERAVQHGKEEVHAIAQRNGVAPPASTAPCEAALADVAAQLRECAGVDAADASSAQAAATRRDAELTRAHTELAHQMRQQEATQEQLRGAAARIRERITESEQGARYAGPVSQSAGAGTALHRDADALRAELDEACTEMDVGAAVAALATLETERDALAADLVGSNHMVEQRVVAAQRDRQRHEKAKALEKIDETRSLHALEEKLDGARAQQARLQGAHTLRMQEVHAKEASCEALQQEVQDTLHGEFASVEEGVKTAREEITILQESLGVLEHASEFFQRILKQGREQHVCLGCNRVLPEASMPAFEAHIQASLERSQPEQRAELTHDLADWESQLARLYAARDALAKLEYIAQEVKAMGRAAAEADADAKRADADLNETTRAVADARLSLAVLSGFQRSVAEAADLDAALAALPAAEEDSGRRASSPASLRGRLDALGEQIKAQQAAMNAARRRQDGLRDAAVAAERRVHEHEMQSLHAQQADAARAAAALRLEELHADLHDVQTRLTTAHQMMDTLREPVAAAEKELRAFRESRQQEEATRAAASRRRDEDLQRLDDIRARIAQTRGGEADGALAQSTAALAEAAAHVAAARSHSEELNDAVHAREAALREAQAREANLRNNMRYRQVLGVLAETRTQLDALDLAEAHRMHTEFTARYDAARKAENALSGEAAQLRGSIQGTEAEIARREAELRDEFRDVHQRYVRQLVHIKVGAMANRDLDTYAAAMHQAILQYHAIKMEEVNQTLDYLWRKTYQGTDIDTVLIRSDADGRVGANGVRSYQYRVCMNKDSIELDMRGRCSAGQKVLACILIRLALADSFSAHCGFLALDEPTTNLDRENVEALAASIVDLLAERRHQANFQLIVITHDEDFLSRVAQSDALTEYWRVSRDENLNSRIDREQVRRF
ncbi:DNA repair protein rad50 [Malassezia sp. CBS 17886]|nr:DNA repair protein rad50 [Malassezia sp. CBS 17886]